MQKLSTAPNLLAINSKSLSNKQSNCLKKWDRQAKVCQNIKKLNAIGAPAFFVFELNISVEVVSSYVVNQGI